MTFRSSRMATALLLMQCVASSEPTSRRVYGTYLPDVERWGNVRTVADSSGNTYVGVTRANTVVYPNDGLSYPFDSLILKVPADGKALAFTTTLKHSLLTGLAVDPAGNVIVIGSTPLSGFETTAGALEAEAGEGFVAELSPSGSILWATHLRATPYSVTTDATGAIYLAGAAGQDFRPTPGAFKEIIGPAYCSGRYGDEFTCSDAFVAKLSADGSKLLYATLLGGTREDSASAIAVDQTGSVVIVGETKSRDFPASPGAFQPAYGGGPNLGPVSYGDGFVARLDPTGSKLLYATYLGGSNPDIASGVILDSLQNAYITGTTRSHDFPVTANAFQKTYGGDRSFLPALSGDGFLVKLDPAGQAQYATYLGGPDEEQAGLVQMGPRNRLYVALTGAFFSRGRSESPCKPQAELLVIDPESGKPIESADLESLDLFGAPPFAIDTVGIIHVAGYPVRDNDGFLLTPGAFPAVNGYYLERLDLSREDEFAPVCVVNGASYSASRTANGPFAAPGFVVAPGEIISLFGKGIGPSVGVLAPSDKLPRELAGVSVRINGSPLPLLYVSDQQINAVVPYSLLPEKSTISIQRDVFSATSGVTVGPQFPAFFTVGARGQGPAAVINEDGSINSAEHRAKRGSVISVYATGLGRLTGTAPEDAPTPVVGPFPSTAEHFQLFIAFPGGGGAIGMQILYTGPAPGLVAGVYQVNARIPSAANVGLVPIQFAFDLPAGDLGQPGVAVYVQP